MELSMAPLRRELLKNFRFKKHPHYAIVLYNFGVILLIEKEGDIHGAPKGTLAYKH